MVEITYQMLLSTFQTAGILIGIFYYISSLRNQDKARQAQLLMQMHMYRQTEVRSMDARLMDVITQRITGFQEYLERVEHDGNFEKLNMILFNFYEAMGVFVKAGYFDIRNVALMWAGQTRMYYENIFEPIIDEARVFYDFPRFGSETEYLCKALIRYMDEHPELKT
jgi:hypothetical protein